MNDGERNKIIIHTSWLFEALTSQYRSLFSDVKICSSIGTYKNSKMFINFTQNLKMASVLLSQAYRNFTSIIKSTNLNGKHMQNIYNLYVKRSFYQERKAYETFNNLQYDKNIASDNEYKHIYAKMYNLNNLYGQIDNNFYHMQDF